MAGCDEGGITYIEFHEDDVEGIAELDALPLRQSFHAPPGSKILKILGQDECIVTQYLLRLHFWCGPNGEIPMLPKSDGAVVMMSAFTGQDLDMGFG